VLQCAVACCGVLQCVVALLQCVAGPVMNIGPVVQRRHRQFVFFRGDEEARAGGF